MHLNNSAWDVVLVICAFGHIMLLLQSFHFASCVCWGVLKQHGAAISTEGGTSEVRQ